MNKRMILAMVVLCALIIASTSMMVFAAPVKYEADKAIINNAKIYDGFPEATDGLCVGYVDFEDSFVEFKVTVADAGKYKLVMNVSTGDDGASHMLSVNGEAVGEIVYARVGNGWGSFADYTKEITLKAGENSIKMAKGNLYAAPDYITLEALEAPKAEAAAETKEEAKTTSNPKTADVVVVPFIAAALVSGAAMFTSRKRK